MKLQNTLLLDAALGKPVTRIPVWCMRQAGRILNEYRQVREAAGSFISLVKNPELAAEVTIQPVDILGVDAAIIFSDILVIPEAMGLPYQMIEQTGPIFEETIKTAADIAKLNSTDMADKLAYVTQAISLTKTQLAGRVPLIGFAGAPFTIFCYMVEGRGSKTFAKAKRMLYSEPTLAHSLLAKITQCTISYLKLQVQAGADLLQVFDSWAGILSPEQYREFALPYIAQICNAIPQVPKTVFAKGAYFVRKDMDSLQCQVVGLDWNMDIAESRSMLPNKTLQGNLDPCVLYGSFADIQKNTRNMLAAFGTHKTIANLGHGLYPDTDPDKVRCFIDTVKAYS
jgi:uroporphyrinogen decarboxylase